MINARTKYMAQLVSEAFNVQEFETQVRRAPSVHEVQQRSSNIEFVQQLFSDNMHKQTLETWFKGQGSAHLFIYYQKPYKINEQGECQDVSGGREEFFITDGEKLKLRGKGCYFMRCTPPGKPITAQGTNDNEVLFGELNEHTVFTLNTVVNNVYKPLIDRLGGEDWGSCDDEHKKEFMQTFERFAKEVREAIQSLASNITLDPYPAVHQRAALELLANPQSVKSPNADMINDFEKIFGEWSEKIEQTLEEAEAERKDDKEAGPRQELEYWKQRMRKLTCVSEQLRSKNCRTVFDVLQHASTGGPDNQQRPRDKIYLATSKWRSIELRVTEALNEAKDNVKYLQTLEKFIEPLYDGNPEIIKDTLPALMNSIKMIHTIARYYNTNERMTGLFIRITNQMITNCRFNIINFRRIKQGLTPVGQLTKAQEAQGKKPAPVDDTVLWDHDQYPPDELIDMLQQCLDLHEAYIKQYEFTKERLQNVPKAKQFDFNPTQIFGRFDLFCRRVTKLKELFSTIKQFKTLEKHNLENIQPIVTSFQNYVAAFKKKNHKLLDFNNNTFDRDFVEFNVDVSSVETSLQKYIDQNFLVITNIEDSLKLLRKFKAILHRDNLRNNLNNKYQTLFQNYQYQIVQIEEQYTQRKSNPPLVRNLPTVSGSITWSRHLFHRISVPMEQFPPEFPKQKDYKRPVKQYNKIGYTLFSYEYLWRQKWIQEVDKAKAGLQATLIIRHPDNNKLYVNFDSEILTLIREAKCLSRIGIDIPESAKIVLLQEEKFKHYHSELQFVLREYERIVNKIRPNTKSLLVPHLEDLEYKLRSGMVTLTWTSMNIDGYLTHVHQGLAKLEQLIININDIMENRIENNLKALSKTVLVNLPQDAQTYTLDEFVEMQEEWIAVESKKLRSKNYEVEGAVDDLIQTICSYQLDQHVEPISAEEIQKLSKYYNWSMYQALLHATKYSLNQMKERICGRRNAPKQVLKPFFEVNVHLDNGESILKPSLEEVQSAINRAASHVLKSTKRVQNWNQKDQPEEEREPFYDWIAKDKEIVKVILLLTGSIQGTKNKVNEFLASFEQYDWLWTKKADEALKVFNKNNPQLEDYEEKLKHFDSILNQILAIESSNQIGALSLKTENVKSGLKTWIDAWKDAFSRDLHKKAKNLLESLTDEIKQIKLKLDKPVKDIDSLGGVMGALEEIRQKQSEIALQFKPINEMYALIDTYFSNIMEKDEIDSKTAMVQNWETLVVRSETIRNDLALENADYKLTLIKSIKHLVGDVKEFRKNFEEKGPAVPGIAPREALNRLRMYADEYSIRKRKYDSYYAGEILFGLPHVEYPLLVKTEQEIELLDKLYSLYSKVKDTIAKWREIPWSEVVSEIDKMIETCDQFARDCAKLPGSLKKWDAYKEMKQEIEDMTEMLPLVTAMAKPSIRNRHWDEVIELMKMEIPYESESFTLSQFFQCPLLKFREEIEEITESADKQLKLENSLKNDIIAAWEEQELQIKGFKDIETPCFLGGNISDIQEKLEDHLNQLNQMNAQKFVTPFKTEVTDRIALLADVSDVIEKWLKVQQLWSNLVSVFTSGDIARNLPTEAKLFSANNKIWLKNMERAFETKNVVACCQNELLKTSNINIMIDLEKCQKQLDSYLEQKRGIFPRFYFCSNADLLKILSQGSDPNAVQDDFEKLFDAINSVTFDADDRRLIVSIHQHFKGCTEDVQLDEGVKAEGQIEDWLNKLEKEMQKTMKKICKSASQDCFSMPLREFIDNYQSQVALLGIQFLWTNRLQEALSKGKKADKTQDLDRKKKDNDAIMKELTQMCLEEKLTSLVRVKVETLVTIQVYQRDKFDEIISLVKGDKIKDENDFDWLKNTRCYWKSEEATVAVAVTDVEFIYQYEFLGVKERLCITDLTDRCYVTLSQALGMMYGGAPAGPAGTGKTETVKDLGRTLGIFVVVTNCSDEHKFRDMAAIFKGICQSGLWGCFDEFNRISLPTLSVVAAQVESITNAKKQKLQMFLFPGEVNKIRLIHACAYFITMNPGYAGRQELPENLKVLFRGVTMMVPNRQTIMMVKLASVGYDRNKPLSIKFNVLYKLCEEQLSKQRHYDFGLRNILSVLRTAGNSKRAEPPGADEEMIVARTLRDMNLSKFVAQDLPLFHSLIKDIFPKQERIPTKKYTQMEEAIKKYLSGKNLENKAEYFLKCIQLYETALVRHGFMLVGAAGCAKTTIYATLISAWSSIQTEIKMIKMNPKAIKGQEMYGVMNNVSQEWIAGVYSEIWKKANAKTNKHITWINCDGPVDAIWIENLNTVLDDNKILTLANNERIPMSDNCKMTFEVENLDNASPATVSRCGIVYISPTDLGWAPLFKTWSKDRAEFKSYCSSEEGEWLEKLVDKYIIKPNIEVQLQKGYTYTMPAPMIIRVSQFLTLLTAVLLPHIQNQEPVDKKLFELYFIYCMTWAFAGLFEIDDRMRFQREILEKCNAPLPNISAARAQTDKETVFDYCVNYETKSWKAWEVAEWVPPKRLIFSQLLIPTQDSTRAEFIMQRVSQLPVMRHKERNEAYLKNTLLVGGSGTAKTSVAIMFSNTFDAAVMSFKRINFSSATEPRNFQDSIEAEVERKQAKIFQPPNNKEMTVFLDDLSMPFVNAWGDQITLEITRQLIDQKGFYFLEKDMRGYFKQINNLQFLGAMNHPGGGRNDIPNRLKRQFFSLNMTPPSNKSVADIYGSVLGALFNPKKYTQDITNMKGLLIDATISVWETVSKKLLPTPAKFHYLFTIRELARVFQGIAKVAQASEHKVIQNTLNCKEKIAPQLFLIGLWRHECERTFMDKLTNDPDKKVFTDILSKVTKEKFRESLGYDDEQLMTNMIFCDFQRKDIYDEYGELVSIAPFVYEACPDLETCRKLANTKLEGYNEKNPSKKMALVIFDDALGHLLKICRIINTPGGNAMLVGVGGSGKQSLTKLSSYICRQFFFQVTLNKNYGDTQFKEDIKALYGIAGPQGGAVTFILTDAEIKSETFLEAVNSMLATGEIPGLFLKEDRDLIPLQQKPVYMKEAGSKGEDPNSAFLWNYFINRCKDHLHTVLCFSPVSPKFRTRSQKFPSLFSTCAIDWFLPWPEEALVSVSDKFLKEFKIDNNKEVKASLIVHMGKVHKLVDEVCAIYKQKMGRNVYVTPKSYLSFIDMYKEVYQKKFKELDVEERNINSGLDKLAEATRGIDELKIALKKEDATLKIAADETAKLLAELEIENKKADAQAADVAIVTEQCINQKNTITQEKEEAQKELAAAMPALEKAVGAVASIRQADITELKGTRQPTDTTKLILEAVQLLFQDQMLPVEVGKYNMLKQETEFVANSYEAFTKFKLQGPLLKQLYDFSENEKDNINEETIELLEPYLLLKAPNGAALFEPDVAKKASAALAGLCTWAAAMSDYHKASKIVKPKLSLLEKRKIQLAEAEEKLAQAEANLRDVKDLQDRLSAKFKAQVDAKDALMEKAQKTKRKMDQANKLINSLADNKERWIKQSQEFKDTKNRLVGDVAKASAFISYCGPFNSQFRDLLNDQYFSDDLKERNIPFTEQFSISEFLVDPVTISEWALEKLPTDDLSIQNGIMVTRSTRYPLMIDPQGQGLTWIQEREPLMKQYDTVITLNVPNLRDTMKIPIENGYPVLIESIENEVDPLLDPVLEKQYIVKGRKKLIILGGGEPLDFDEKFNLYMTSRLANPHFLPELAAKTTIIDFTVTQGGLEQQLLGRLISFEQKALEDTLNQIQEEVTANNKMLAELEASLLDRLANAEGSLLDDVELIDVLANIKTKSREVNEKLTEANEKKIDISEKREAFRPVAARGSVLYFCVVEMTQINWMYNTSLGQFLDLFYWSISNSQKAPTPKDRVANIIQALTRKVYRYINRGLFERDKTTFKLMMCFKILIKAGVLTGGDVGVFLKAGGGIDDRNKKYNWMDQKVWLNIVALSRHKFGTDHSFFYKELPERIGRLEKDWKKFFDENEPENAAVPDFEDKIQADANIGHFLHLCLIRSVREDRTVLASQQFIKRTLGDYFTAPVTDQIVEMWEESRPNKPVLFLLSAGADPTANIDEFAKKKKQFPTNKVSMGEEQEGPASRAIVNDGFRDGRWLILNNCHLSLEFMGQMEEVLNPKNKEVHEDFRLWITCQESKEFPLGLLQMAIKVTTEPPKGLQAGIARTFQTVINQDFLEKVEPYEKWRAMVYMLCFMHSIVQERRKFGPLGFCIPYEFNNSDLEASLSYMEKHMTQSQLTGSAMSFKAMQYMCCDVQYGGRITDDLDREMFKTYGAFWIVEDIFKEKYCFNNLITEYNYHIPDFSEHQRYLEHINTLPEKDNPLIFGLNGNADLTYRLKESGEMIFVLVETQPKESGGGGGLSPSEVVKEKLQTELIKALPPDFIEIEYEEKLRSLRGPKSLSGTGKDIPLNVFLFQEIQRIQRVLDIVRNTMNDMVLAIDGQIIMTQTLVDCIDNVFDFRVPRIFQYDPTGVEISWLTPSLAGWLKGLVDRHYQLNQWLCSPNRERPPTFWLTGFFNPQGFLTSMKQEVTRQHRNEGWALDEVDYKSDVQKEIIPGDDGRFEGRVIKPIEEGVLVHGLYLEGAQWHKTDKRFEEQTTKDLFFNFPIIHISAETTNKELMDKAASKKADAGSKEKTHFFCPIYKYPKRNDRYLIVRVYLKAEGPPGSQKSIPAGMTAVMNWKLKGVALLCCKE